MLLDRLPERAARGAGGGQTALLDWAIESAAGLRVVRVAGVEPEMELAALGLLSEVAEQQPLLCVIDDAQWLDRAPAQALAFVARRLLAEPVALVFATHEPGQEFRGMPELLVGGLRDGDARELRWPAGGRPSNHGALP